MRANFRLGRAASGAAMLTVSMLVIGWFASSAFAASLQITNAAAPEQAVPTQLTFSGQADPGSVSSVEAVARPAGGAPCQANFTADQAAAGSVSTVIFAPGTEAEAPGAFQETSTYTPAAPGAYLICGWVEQPTGSSTTVTGPISQTFTARAPQVLQLTVSLAAPAHAKSPFQIDYMTQTDQLLALYSIVKPAGAPCASSFEVDQLQDQAESTLWAPGTEPHVFAGPLLNYVHDTETIAGAYTACTWLEGPTTGEVDSLVTTPFIVGAPVKVPPKTLKLHLTNVTASKRHGVSVAGTSTAAFAGRLQAVAACGSSTTKRSLTARAGHFKGSLALPTGCGPKQHVKLTVSWPGSAAFTKRSAAESVPIRS
jgi:hypothetical protein